jgi:GTP pyrophosphokinase
MLTAQELISKIKSYHPNLNEDLILKSYNFAKNAHGNQKRHSGESYFSHPVAVAEIVADLKLDEESISTALLHDVAEDTEVTIAEIAENFNEDIAKIVDGVTKLSKIENLHNSDRVAENFRKLTMAMSQDIRVLLVKLADRLHNMRTIDYVPSKEKKLKQANESLEIYAPLAGRIGLNKIKDELQDLSFQVINPEVRNSIISKLNEIRENNKNIIERIINKLHEILREQDVDCEIFGREKKPYSIWIKMKAKNIGFYNLHDIMAFRIVVKDVANCYKTLGIINSYFNMIPGSFDDYISTPKENGYRSLHLAILAFEGNKIEIQIRDTEMHESSELGFASHWNYKEKFIKKNQNAKIQNQEKDQYRWIRELLNLFENSESASEVLRQHKLNMHKDEVFCFTPNGDIFNLPYGATIVDFAYAIHSEVGNSCVSAKVNGMIAPLRHSLENGDQVEIITAKNSKPSPNWLQFVTTSKAKSAIKNFIRNQKYQEYSTLGQAIIQKYFALKNLEFNDKLIEKSLSNFNKKTLADLYFKVADGTITRQEILKNIYPDFVEEGRVINYAKPLQKKLKKSSYHLPITGLVDGMAIRFAGCCNPIPGDSILGIINTGTGVTIHQKMCHNLKNLALNPQNVVDVCWREDEDVINENFSSQIRVVVENRSGALAEITSLIAKKKININQIKTTNRCQDLFEVMIDINVKNVEHLEEILSALRFSKKTIQVERIAGYQS